MQLFSAASAPAPYDSLKNLTERCRTEEFRRLEMKAADELQDYTVDLMKGEEEHDTEE